MDAIRGDANYHASRVTILKLLGKGWIETKTGRGLRKYAITAAGEDALRTKVRTYWRRFRAPRRHHYFSLQVLSPF